MRRFAPLLLSSLLAFPVVARAGWLGLAAGTWDLELSCVQHSIACPTSFHATVTIADGGATALATSFAGQTFAGDPVDESATVVGFTSERSTVYDDPLSFFSVVRDVDGSNPLGLSDRWWTYCRNASATTCAPVADGNWSATIVPVPEPSSWALMAAGLSCVAALGRRRRERITA